MTESWFNFHSSMYVTYNVITSYLSGPERYKASPVKQKMAQHKYYATSIDLYHTGHMLLIRIP